jgi:hypothetical protein
MGTINCKKDSSAPSGRHRQGNDIERAVPLGALTAAGFRELFTGSVCCQETLLTYALLGDPLTRLRVLLTWRVMLPLVQR